MPIFECYLLRRDSKNGCQKHMHLKDVGLHAQNMIIILYLVVDILGGGGRHGHLMSMEFVTLTMNKKYSHEHQKS